MLLILLAILAGILRGPTIIPVVQPTPKAFETPQSRLWDSDVRDESNLPTDEGIETAADATESLIRGEIEKIDRATPRYRLAERQLKGGGDEGGDYWLKAWYDGKELRRAAIYSGGEAWRQTSTLYFAKGTLIARTTHIELAFGSFASRYRVITNRESEESIYLSPSEHSEEVEAQVELINHELGEA